VRAHAHAEARARVVYPHGARACRGAHEHLETWTGFSRPLGVWGLLGMCERKLEHSHVTLVALHGGGATRTYSPQVVPKNQFPHKSTVPNPTEGLLGGGSAALVHGSPFVGKLIFWYNLWGNACSVRTVVSRDVRDVWVVTRARARVLIHTFFRVHRSSRATLLSLPKTFSVARARDAAARARQRDGPCVRALEGSRTTSRVGRSRCARRHDDIHAPFVVVLVEECEERTRGSPRSVCAQSQRRPVLCAHEGARLPLCVTQSRCARRHGDAHSTRGDPRRGMRGEDPRTTCLCFVAETIRNLSEMRR